MNLPKPSHAPSVDLHTVFKDAALWQERALEAQAKGAQAFSRLLNLAETSHSGQARRIAEFVAGAFDGEFRWNMFDLRALDVEHSDDMLLCLDAIRWGRSDLCNLVPDGEQRVRGVISEWKIQRSLT